MAEAIAITSCLVGISSLLFTAKTALTQLAHDRDRLKHQEDDLAACIGDLDIAISSVDLWKRFWRLNHDCHPTFPQDLWGSGGCSAIKYRLNTIKRQASRTCREIEKAYNVKIDGHSHSNSSSNDVVTTLAFKTSGWDLGRGLKNALFRSEIIAKHLKELSENFKRLDQLSKIKLQEQHGLQVSVDSQPELKRWVDHFFTETFLFNLARESRLYSEALYGACTAGDIQSSHLALDELVRVPSDDTDLSHTLIAKPNIVYDLIIQEPHTRYLSGTGKRFVILAVKDNARKEWCTESQPMGFLRTHAASDCRCSRRDCKRHFWLEIGDSRATNLMSEDIRQVRYFHTSSSHSISLGEAHKSLSSLLCTSRNDFITKLHRTFAHRERLKLAYSITLYSFVMFQTSWTAEFCSCMVTFRPGTRQRIYSIRLQQGDNHLSEASEYRELPAYTRSQHQCRRFIQNQPIKNLGLLLLEIAIAQPIRDAVHDQNADEIWVNFHHDQGVGHSASAWAIDLLPVVAEQASDDYADIVRWCLNQTLDLTVDEAHSDEEFYHNVLKPLHIRYQAEIAGRTRVERRNEARALRYER